MSLRPLVVVAAVLVACSSSSSTTGTVRVEDRPLPELAGTGLNGEHLSAANDRGHVLVVSVWATWCADCEKDMPGFVDVANRYAAHGVRFLGLNPGEYSAAQPSEWVRHYHVPYPSIQDPSERFAASLGYVGMPATYVVDRDGTIRFSIVGGSTSEATLSGLIDQLLTGASSTPSPAQTSASIATAAKSAARYTIENLNRDHALASDGSRHRWSARYTKAPPSTTAVPR
jgi:thiol-disulfide isomerase/thioredoxin